MRKLEISAETVELARESVKRSAPGEVILHESVFQRGGETSVEGAGATLEAARKAANGRVSKTARNRREEVVREQRIEVTQVYAADEKACKRVAGSTNHAQIEAIRLQVPGRKGLFGLGKRENRFEVTVNHLAIVRIHFRDICKVEFVLGSAAEQRACGACEKCHRTREEIEREFAMMRLRGVFIYGEGSGVLLYCNRCTASFCGGCQIDLGMESGCPRCESPLMRPF